MASKDLNVGMYVRGNYYQYRGKIGKIIKNYQNSLEIAYKDSIISTTVGDFIDDNWDINGKQYKDSYDILDLVEKDDVVVLQYKNKYNDIVSRKFEVERVTEEYIDFVNRRADWVYDRKNKLFIDDFGLGQPIIKEILTHEQFEKESYKIGE